jgi:hypothetical protein
VLFLGLYAFMRSWGWLHGRTPIRILRTYRHDRTHGVRG